MEAQPFKTSAIQFSERYSEAIAYAERIQGDTDRREAATAIGLGLARRGDVWQICEIARRFFLTNRPALSYHVFMTKVMNELICAKRFPELDGCIRAISIAQKILKNPPSDWNTQLSLIVSTLVKKDRLEAVLKVAALIRDDDTAKGAVYVLVSNGFVQRGQIEKALEYAQRVPRTYLGRDSAFVCIAKYFADTGQCDQALSIAKELVNPENANLIVRDVTYAMAKNQQFDQAIEQADQAPRFKAEFFTCIAKHMAEAGRFDQALLVADTKIEEKDRNTVVSAIAAAMIPDHISEACGLVWSCVQKGSGGSLIAQIVVRAPDEEKYHIVAAWKSKHPEEAKALFASITNQAWIERIKRNTFGERPAAELARAGRFEEALAIAGRDQSWRQLDGGKDLLLLAHEMVRRHQVSDIIILPKSLPEGIRQELLQLGTPLAVRIGRSSEECSAVQRASVDEGPIKEIKKLKQFMKLIAEEAIREAVEARTMAISQETLFSTAVRFFENGQLREEAEKFFADDVPCHCDLRADVVRSIAAKLLVEAGDVRSAILTANKIRVHDSWKSAIYELVAKKDGSLGRLPEEFFNRNPFFRDKVYLERVRRFV